MNWPLMAAVGVTMLGAPNIMAAGSHDPDFAAMEDPKRPKAMVCKRIRETGTHFSRRICVTREEWDAMSTKSRSDIRDMFGEHAGAPMQDLGVGIGDAPRSGL